MDARIMTSRFGSLSMCFALGLLGFLQFAHQASALERQSLNVTVISRTGIPDELETSPLLVQIALAANIDLKVRQHNATGVDFENTDVFVLVSDQFGSDYGIYFGGLKSIFGDRDSPFRKRFMGRYDTGCHYTDTSYGGSAEAVRRFLIILEPEKLSRSAGISNPYAECLVAQFLKVVSNGQFLEDEVDLTVDEVRTVISPKGITSLQNAAGVPLGGTEDAAGRN